MKKKTYIAIFNVIFAISSVYPSAIMTSHIQAVESTSSEEIPSSVKLVLVTTEELDMVPLKVRVPVGKFLWTTSHFTM